MCTSLCDHASGLSMLCCPVLLGVQFKAFMQCAIDNSDYYEPFLSMLLGEEEDEEAQKAQDAKEAGTGGGKA